MGSKMAALQSSNGIFTCPSRSEVVSGPWTQLNSHGIKNGNAAIEQRYCYVPAPLRGRVGPLYGAEFERYRIENGSAAIGCCYFLVLPVPFRAR